MKYFIVTALVLMASTAVTAQDEAPTQPQTAVPNMATLGAGSQSCATFLEQSTDETMAVGYMYWMTGYITGLNNMASLEAARGEPVRGGWIDPGTGIAHVTRAVNLDQMNNWLRRYCQQNPSQSYQIAVTALAYQLADELQQETGE